MHEVERDLVTNLIKDESTQKGIQKKLGELGRALGAYRVAGTSADGVLYRFAQCNAPGCTQGIWAPPAYIGHQSVTCPSCGVGTGHKTKTGVFCPPPVYKTSSGAIHQDMRDFVAYAKYSYGDDPHQGKLDLDAQKVVSIDRDDFARAITEAVLEEFDRYFPNGVMDG